MIVSHLVTIYIFEVPNISHKATMWEEVSKAVLGFILIMLTMFDLVFTTHLDLVLERVNEPLES